MSYEINTQRILHDDVPITLFSRTYFLSVTFQQYTLISTNNKLIINWTSKATLNFLQYHTPLQQPARTISQIRRNSPITCTLTSVLIRALHMRGPEWSISLYTHTYIPRPGIPRHTKKKKKKRQITLRS